MRFQSQLTGDEPCPFQSPPEGSIESFLAATGSPRLILDLRRAQAGSEESGWLTEPRTFRSLGGIGKESQFSPQTVSDSFDVLVYLATTTAGDVVDLVPEAYHLGVARALERAGDNRAEWEATLQSVRPEQREGTAFLMVHAPPRDLATLKRDFLIENIQLAYQARSEVPWGPDLPEELFLNDVLPYANVNERRDAWRRDFYERFLPLVQTCATPGEAALRLAQEVLPTVGVQYHAAKRRRPDQSPYESMELGYASCTGMTILLVDACRAVAVPARLVSAPPWINHTWTEIWDRQWHFVDIGSPELNQAWFVDLTRQADENQRENSLYAASWSPTDTWWPTGCRRWVGHSPRPSPTSWRRPNGRCWRWPETAAC